MTRSTSSPLGWVVGVPLAIAWGYSLDPLHSAGLEGVWATAPLLLLPLLGLFGPRARSPRLVMVTTCALLGVATAAALLELRPYRFAFDMQVRAARDAQMVPSPGDGELPEDAMLRGFLEDHPALRHWLLGRAPTSEGVPDNEVIGLKSQDGQLWVSIREFPYEGLPVAYERATYGERLYMQGSDQGIAPTTLRAAAWSRIDAGLLALLFVAIAVGLALTARPGPSRQSVT